MRERGQNNNRNQGNGQKNRQNNNKRNRSSRGKDRKRNLRKDKEIEKLRDMELEEIENALLDQTARIIDQLMEVITSRLKNENHSQEDAVNRARQQHYKDNSTYERLYGNENYHPNRTNERGVISNYHDNDNNQSGIQSPNVNQNQTSNVTMNIQRPRSMTEQPQEQENVILPGGAQLYPGQRYNPPSSSIQRVGQNNMQPRQVQPQVQNRYQPTVGPGGRAEAPRDNVIIGSQALQYASRVANRVGSSEISMRSSRNPVQTGMGANRVGPGQVSGYRNPSMPMARPTVNAAPVRPSGPVMSAPRPAAAPVARAAPAPSVGPAVAQAA